MRQWTHKVVKRMRGGDGEWFDFPTAATFTSESKARAYAAQFAAEQRAAGVTTARIEVRSRRKIRQSLDCCCGYTVRTHVVYVEYV